MKLRRLISQHQVMFLEFISPRSYHFHMFSLHIIVLKTRLATRGHFSEPTAAATNATCTECDNCTSPVKD